MVEISEIIYSIAQKEKADAYLILNLYEYGAPKSKKLYLSYLLSKVKGDEKKLLLDLVKEEMKFSKSKGDFESEETKAFNTIHIERSKVFSLLKHLAATSRLYYKTEKLLIDFFSKSTFYFEGQRVEEGTLAKGIFKRGDVLIPYDEVDFIFASDPIFFIHKSRLSLVSKPISLKWLVGQIIIDEKRQEVFLDDDDESTYPRLLFNDKQKETSYEMGPLPILKLLDPYGSFANLEMDYSKCSIKKSPQDEKMWHNDLLETDFIYKHEGRSNYFCPLDKVYKSIAFLLEMGWQVIDSTGKKVVLKVSQDFQYSLEDKKVKVKGAINFGDYKASIDDVALSFNRRQTFLQLSDNTSGLLDVDSKEYKELFEECQIAKDSIKKPLYSYFAFLEKNNNQSMSYLTDTSLIKLKDSYLKIFTKNSCTIDPDFKGVLRNYQEVGLNWLLFLKEFGFGGLLADEMGLGKTVQVLAFIAHIKEKKPILIVAPTSLIFNWQKEIKKFLPSRSCTHYSKDVLIDEADIVLISYTKLRIDCPRFSCLNFALIVLDEAQIIKNSDTQIAQAVFSLEADCRLSLTGTPVENSLNDLWSHYHFLIKELLGKKENFEKIAKISFSDNRYAQMVKNKIKPFFLRRKKEEVAKDLPEKIEQVVFVEMSEEQRAIYEKFLFSFKANLLSKVSLEGIKKHKMEVFEAILRLRQLAVHPDLFLFQEDQKSFSSGKWDVVVEDIQTVVAEGKKVLVYSQFTNALKLLKQSLVGIDSLIAYLDGSTKDRSAPCRQFQEDEHTHIFLISLKAGGVGLNLTKADYVFLLDPWWNVASENQAIDRAHRIGREGIVIAKRYVTAQSIEEKMMTLKEAKRKLVESIFSEDISDFELSFDDLEFLLS
jgi:SNF2 family DNA or RNA helicase